MRPALLLLVTFAASCGYRFSAGGALPENVRQVCAPVFRNATAEPGLEVVFTEAMRQRLIRRGAAGTPCQATIEGEVQSVYTAPTVLQPDFTLSTYRVYATAVLRLVKEGRVLSQTSVTGSEDYRPGDAGDIVESDANRQAALQRLADSLMQDGYARLASDW